MNPIDWIIAALGIVFIAFGTASVMDDLQQTQTPRSAQECVDPATLHDDLSLILDRYGLLFDRTVWSVSIRDDVGNGHLTATFQAWEGGPPSVASVSVMLWPCGYSERDLAEFYSNSAVDARLSTWERVGPLVRCEVRGVRIMDVPLAFEGEQWIARKWIELVAPTRLLEGFFAVPEDQMQRLDDIGEQLYPGAGRCTEKGEDE